MPHVNLVVTEELLRAWLLRLPDTCRIVAATMLDDFTVTFEIDDPGAPDDAVVLEPTYVRDEGPDPVRLTALSWRSRNGSATTKTFPAPDAKPCRHDLCTALTDREIGEYLVREQKRHPPRIQR